MNNRVVLAVVALLFSLQASAQDFVGWRTDGTGAYTNATPPKEWSKTKNILWSTPLTDFSNATPVIAGEKLFICAEPETLLCINTADGKILWQKTNTLDDALPPEELEKKNKALQEADPILKEKTAVEKEKGAADREKGAADNEMKAITKDIQAANDTLKTTPDDADAKKKLEEATKKQEDVKAKQDAASKKQQEANAKLADVNKRLQPYVSYLPLHPHNVNGFSSSTPATDGKSVFTCYGNSVVAAYDLDGKRLWIRKFENPTISWGPCASPVLVAGKLLISINELQALNPQTGETLWTAKVQTAYGTPAVTRIGDVDVIITAAGDVVRVSDGKVLAPHVTHLEKEQKDRYYASPVLYDGILYAVNQKGIFSALDAKTGATIYEKSLGVTGTFYPSVTLAGKNLYVSSDNGTTVIVEPGKEFKEIARNSLETFRCCPVFDGKRIYVRGMKALYCIAEP
jgi:outer membrane protein assembly factor BamB